MSGCFCWLKIFVISEDVYMLVVCFLFLFLQTKMCLLGSCMKFVYWYEDIRSVMVKNLVGIRLNSVVWRSEIEESPNDGLWIILFQEYYQPKLHALSGKSLKMTSPTCASSLIPPQKKMGPIRWHSCFSNSGVFSKNHCSRQWGDFTSCGSIKQCFGEICPVEDPLMLWRFVFNGFLSKATITNKGRNAWK